MDLLFSHALISGKKFILPWSLLPLVHFIVFYSKKLKHNFKSYFEVTIKIIFTMILKFISLKKIMIFWTFSRRQLDCSQAAIDTLVTTLEETTQICRSTLFCWSLGWSSHIIHPLIIREHVNLFLYVRIAFSH